MGTQEPMMTLWEEIKMMGKAVALKAGSVCTGSPLRGWGRNQLGPLGTWAFL